MNATEYKVNEIFYSVQAEGRNEGRPALFVRLAGCNLRCPFCDTNHEEYMKMRREQIEAEANALDPTGEAMVVFTGGEPTMQLNDREIFFPKRFVAIETNGTMPVPRWVDWITVSPKMKMPLSDIIARGASEIKCVYGSLPDNYLITLGRGADCAGIPTYIQPMADAEGRFDIAPALAFAKGNPKWIVSLQWHKLFNIR
jgi:organic radical activating enzyme